MDGPVASTFDSIGLKQTHEGLKLIIGSLQLKLKKKKSSRETEK